MIVISFIAFFFILFIGAIQSKMMDKTYEKKNIIIKDIVKNVKEEINLAAQSQDGYYREFEIPDKIINDEYGIYLFGRVVYANTTDQKHAIALSTANATGILKKGTNIIQKQNGEINLN